MGEVEAEGPELQTLSLSKRLAREISNFRRFPSGAS